MARPMTEQKQAETMLVYNAGQSADRSRDGPMIEVAFTSGLRRDAELRHVKSGELAVLSFSAAADEPQQEDTGGARQPGGLRQK